jgi:hypothetical protein
MKNSNKKKTFDDNEKLKHVFIHPLPTYLAVI